jgi:hypothetical protein
VDVNDIFLPVVEVDPVGPRGVLSNLRCSSVSVLKGPVDVAGLFRDAIVYQHERR